MLTFMKKMLLVLTFIVLAYSNCFCQQSTNLPGKLKMMTDSLTIPIGKQNGIVITLDAVLNKVFRNNQVYNYQQLYPSSSYQLLRNIYYLECNCNEHLLKDTLEAAPFYAYVQFIYPIILLNVNDEIKSPNFNLYPMPIASTVSFEIKERIEKAEIVDLTGKIIFKVDNPKNSLDLSALKSGKYLLLLTSKDQTHKRIILKE